ncbi:MAG: hypothetical protein AAF433_19570 [Bacteroidota bacterium]
MDNQLLDTDETRGIKPNSNWWRNYLSIIFLFPIAFALILFFGEELVHRIRWQQELFELVFGAAVLVALVVGLAFSAKFLAQREPRISFFQLTIATLIQVFFFIHIFYISIELIFQLVVNNTLGPVEFFSFLNFPHTLEVLIYAGMFQAILGFVVKIWRQEALNRYLIFMLLYFALAFWWVLELQYKIFG